MICACLLYQHPGLARNDHPAIHIRLEMNSIRTDLWDAHGAEFEQVRAEDIEGFAIDANAGTRALRLAIERALNDVKYEHTPEFAGAWRDPRELLAGPQTYIWRDIEFVGRCRYGLRYYSVLWEDANGERYNAR
jgi:hypothetical protein